MTHLPIDLPTDLPTYQQIYRLPSYLPTALHTDRCTYLQIHIPIYRSTGDLLTYLPNNSDTSTYLYTNLHTYLLIYRLPTDVPTYQQTYLTTHKRVNANYPNRLALRRHTKHRPEARGCRRRAPAPTRHLTLLLQRVRQEISKNFISGLPTDRPTARPTDSPTTHKHRPEARRCRRRARAPARPPAPSAGPPPSASRPWPLPPAPPRGRRGASAFAPWRRSPPPTPPPSGGPGLSRTGTCTPLQAPRKPRIRPRCPFPACVRCCVSIGGAAVTAVQQF